MVRRKKITSDTDCSENFETQESVRDLDVFSLHLPGPLFLRYYPAHRLVTWQPHGTLDDLMLGQIAAWLVAVEKGFLLFKRFIDLSELAEVAISTDHLFEFARDRARQFPGKTSARTALFCERWVGFAIAHLYAMLMENTLVEALRGLT